MRTWRHADALRDVGQGIRPMSWVKRIYPFNAEQTVNIASEFGPLVALFVVNV